MPSYLGELALKHSYVKEDVDKNVKEINLFNCQIYELTCCLLSLRIQRW